MSEPVQLTPDEWLRAFEVAARLVDTQTDPRTRLAQVEELARSVVSRVVVLSERPVQVEQVWEGTVVSVEDPAISQDGRTLEGLGKITIRTDLVRDNRPIIDYGWVLRSTTEGKELLRQAAACKGWRVRYTKVRIANKSGQTRPYITSLMRLGERGGSREPLPDEPSIQQQAPRTAGGSREPLRSDSVSNTLDEVFRWAESKGMPRNQLKRLVMEIFGPLNQEDWNKQTYAAVCDDLAQDATKLEMLTNEVKAMLDEQASVGQAQVS